MAPTENSEQRMLVKWIRFQPKFAGLLIKLNNEGKRSLAQGYNLKLMGMEPGASDLFLAYPTPRYHGLWLEIKQNRKYLPSEMQKGSFAKQALFLEHMKAVGYAGEFCYGFEDGKRVIEAYLLTVSAPR